MILKNLQIVTNKKVIHGYIEIDGKKIKNIVAGDYHGTDQHIIDGQNNIAFPGFIDLHIHGSCGIDFMDASVQDYNTIAKALYSEGTTTFLATTLTSSHKALKNVCKTVAKARKEVPSLYGIHLEGPYINAKYKGAQNESYIREPNIEEFNELVKVSHKNIRYITMAPESNNALEFIKNAVQHNVVVSAGHSDASFNDIQKAIEAGLSNTTHTHNAMSGHHHRRPGIVTAAMYFDGLYTEMICDKIHVCEESLKTFYKIVGSDRFIIVTDALLGKHSNIDKFQLYGLDCIKKDGAAYLESGPLAGSLLNMCDGVKNVKECTNASLIDLAKVSSTNAAKCLKLKDRGVLAKGKLADIVIVDSNFKVLHTIKLGEKVY